MNVNFKKYKLIVKKDQLNFDSLNEVNKTKQVCKVNGRYSYSHFYKVLDISVITLFTTAAST